VDAPEQAAPVSDSRPAPVAGQAKPRYELAGRAERLGPTWLTRARVERTISLLSPLLLLLIWEIAAWFGKIDTRFFPSPSAIFAEAGQMIRTGELWSHLSISLSRIIIGFLLGAIPGILIGLATGLFSPVRAVVQPIVDATFPIPKIAILPLFIMTLGLGEESKYAIIATGVIYFVLINTAAGVRNIDRIYLDVGKNYGAGRWMMFIDVALPGAMPLIMAGLKLGMGVALLVIVSAEFVGAKSGIGYMIWTSWQVFQVEKMYVGLLVCAALGFALSYLLEYAERLLIPWKPRQG
jgi:NitT/TauT family transport system permease protein